MITLLCSIRCRLFPEAARLPIVRVSSNTQEHIRRALDLGAAGIMIPHINNAKQASDASISYEL